MGRKRRDRKLEQTNMKIRIRRKYKYFKFHNIVMILCLVTISLMSGAIATEFILDSYINNNENQSSGSSEKNMNELSKNDYLSIMKKIAPSLVTISNSEDKFKVSEYVDGNITGIVIDKKGYIITNLSKVKDYEKIYVKPSSIGSPITEGKIIGQDEFADVAIIKIDYEKLSPISMSNDRKVNIGDNIISIGNAISDDYVGIITPGIVTSLNNKVKLESEYYSLIETNALTNNLNTGGPICNIYGEMIGFTSKYINEKNQDGLYYAVNISTIKNIVENKISLRDVLGVNGRSILDEESNISGVYVDSVISDGYASKAGIKSNDIITRIDNTEIKKTEDIYEAIKSKKSGETAVCVVLRDTETIKVTIEFD